jgi:hypothetical protein
VRRKSQTSAWRRFMFSTMRELFCSPSRICAGSWSSTLAGCHNARRAKLQNWCSSSRCYSLRRCPQTSQCRNRRSPARAARRAAMFQRPLRDGQDKVGCDCSPARAQTLPPLLLLAPSLPATAAALVATPGPVAALVTALATRGIFSVALAVVAVALVVAAGRVPVQARGVNPYHHKLGSGHWVYHCR